MTIEDVKVIIQGDETRTLEMKKTTGELKDEIFIIRYWNKWLKSESLDGIDAKKG